ncbi:putative membrane protein C17A5.08 like [Verticillium longisporum]|nr:putative membrane protein C17A5.08 like [Verticillium longisporum]
MRLSAFACGLYACLVSQVAATALTYKLGAHEKACFYTVTQNAGEKIAFYFAVQSGGSFDIAFYFAVQSGGSFDVDYVVTGPNQKIILDGEKERQGDFVFNANVIGELPYEHTPCTDQYELH